MDRVSIEVSPLPRSTCIDNVMTRPQELNDTPYELRSDVYERLLECRDVHVLNVAVNRVQRKLDMLQRLHSRLLAHKALVSSLAAPTRLISEDLLLRILTCAWSCTVKGDRLQFTLSVASVCRSWREVVIEASELWSTIPINVIHQCLSNLRLFIERSRSRGLEINIDSLRYKDYSESGNLSSREEKEHENMAAVLKLLVPHLNHWKSLSICLPINYITQVLASMEGPADLLGKFSVFPKGSMYGFLRSSMFPAHFKARRLTILDLHGIQFPETVVFQDAVPALRTLKLSYPKMPSRRSMLQMLEPLCHLEHLELVTPEFVTRLDVDHSPRVALAKLRSLSFSHIPPDEVRALLSLFSAPHLKCLTYHSPNSYGSKAPLVVQHSRFFPSLHTVHIDIPRRYWSRPLAVISRWIQGFRCVHIDTFLGRDSDEFIECVGDTTGRLLFPGLSSVIIRSRCHVSAQLLRQMVQGRTRAAPSNVQDSDNPRSTLEEVKVHAPDSLPPEDQEWFERNLESFSWSLLEDDEHGSLTLSFASV
ncbi:hypothetical protein SCP_0905950 [Sparassis crispa]|uniref:F-box domain-containing protein n=1 Tax=Sparassis crispa TaxID=139825 RepID=A0A401GWW4_9APHY|nr:hypothetical protein SCP_0905950 [Sparassis crispa]GBE86715.1 hypothetical protein SCP_0905950 [Sparassis crispa]